MSRWTVCGAARVTTASQTRGCGTTTSGAHVSGPPWIRLERQVYLHRQRNRRHAIHRAAPGEVLYDASQNTLALSSYFELMDRLLPSVLGAFSTQSIRGTRTLLK